MLLLSFPNYGSGYCFDGLLGYCQPRGAAHSETFSPLPYNRSMARGWESKSVEEQMASEPKPSVVTNPEIERKRQARENADRSRQLQTLTMQRENILSQRTSNPGRRTALAAALEQVEAEIAKLS
jgi:hypothetical protein